MNSDGGGPKLRIVQYTWIMRFLACYVGIIKCPANPNPHQNLTKLQWMQFQGLKGHFVLSYKIVMNLIMFIYWTCMLNKLQ